MAALCRQAPRHIVAPAPKVKAAGLTPFAHADYAPGRRFYFLDHDRIEFEIVSYAPRAG
ncbi:hypothetical protein [Sphingomonas cavernae]|uniref:hypothetical protein n=1 Tax=Sphingomonas cavernae TaxID=2320861 RepID=UPI003B75CDC9